MGRVSLEGALQTLENEHLGGKHGHRVVRPPPPYQAWVVKGALWL